VSGWRDVLVLAEASAGAPSRPSLEVLGKARDLADRLGARVACAWPGDEAGAQTLVAQGADEVARMPEHARAGGLAAWVRERRFEAVLAPATPPGQELAARVAARVGVPVMARCTDLDLDEAERVLVGVRAPHSGAMTERVRVPHARPQMATLLPGAARAAWPDDSRTGRVHALDLASAAWPIEVAPAPAAEPQGWRGAERLVVGGALLDEQGFDDLRAVAASLGASWAATRAAVQLGLAPEERALRPWDSFEAPRLCVAAGIEDPLEFILAVPAPRQLVAVGEGPLERAASQVLPGTPALALRALAEALAR
jgi:electron transfer flavoprotein alpha subunit